MNEKSKLQGVFANELKEGDTILFARNGWTYELLSVQPLWNKAIHLMMCLEGDSTKEPVVMMTVPLPTIFDRVIDA